mmetsp:Transcript_7275/g.9827  ORF Transcript_7275/g.9827 Transcript_7275/m.9827 type:complete len:301 (-) Transcript_7275:236-1138(-)|eukprot:CAMPEP_0196580590 /NCGR_PEP_ID=MMETSP1081-20130531/29496_1 /TAXON_ID=36882 /ORGANISM="Pyramimonas amylifera, Strain CCMP720" /LENGTH=300 /DNA_ID=CAMNT_0041900501 /DNA_START=238 /DNA_END=1140 /DNA_ORIENTATION=+
MRTLNRLNLSYPWLGNVAGYAALIILFICYLEFRGPADGTQAGSQSMTLSTSAKEFSSIPQTVSSGSTSSSRDLNNIESTLANLNPEQGELSGRTWGSYEEYTANQKRKLDKSMLVKGGEGIIGTDKKVEDMYVTLFKQNPKFEFAKKSVLCLAARLGGEVRSFTRVGALAIGMDLNPGKDNKWVVQGDFHSLQFASGVFDYVFTNAMDHAFDLGAVTKEVCRVLKPEGNFILDIGGIEQNQGKIAMKIGNHESLFAAAKPELMVQRFVDSGMVVVEQLQVKHTLWTSLMVTFECAQKPH